MNADFVQITLPSKCLTYPGVDPSTIRIRPFRGRDEQLAIELRNGNPKKKLLELMRNILTGVEPEILTLGDVSYIMIWEAINSYSNMYPVRLTCPLCSKNVKIEIDLGELESKELPVDFVQPYEVELSNTKIGLRLLTLEDDIEIFNFSEKGQSTYLYSYALSIVDEDTKPLQRITLLEEMDTRTDLKVIKMFHEKFEHGPDLRTTFICPKCEEEGNVIVPFRLDELISASSVS